MTFRVRFLDSWADDFFKIALWLIHVRDIGSICVRWLIYIWAMTRCDSFICDTWLSFARCIFIHVCAMTHSRARHLFHINEMTYSRVCHDLLICVTRPSFIYVTWFSCMRVTWLLHMCDMTHSHVWQTSRVWHNSIHMCVCVCVCECVRHDSLTSSGFRSAKNESCHTYNGVMSHIWMSHVTHMNESCHTHEWVMSHIWMSHVTHIWMSHVIHMNESCHTYEWVMSHIWMSRVTHHWPHLGSDQRSFLSSVLHTLQHTVTHCNTYCNSLQHTL